MLDTIIKIVLITCVILFIAVLIIKRFCYFRPTFEFMHPHANFEDIREGNIHGWYLKGTNEKVVLFCHGNAGNLSYRQDKLIKLNELGYSVVIFDYSGFGQSKGVPNEQLCYHNACMFLDFILRKFKKENVVLYGESLGAAVAAYAARRYDVKCLIIESGLPSIKTYIKAKVPFLGEFLGIIFPEFNTISFFAGF